MPPLMPDEDKNFGGSLVLDFRKCWRYVTTIYCFKAPRISENFDLRFMESFALMLLIWTSIFSLKNTHVLTSNAASHENHETINAWVSFPFLYGMGLR